MEPAEDQRLIDAQVATELGDEVPRDAEELWLSRLRDATLLVLAVVAHAHEASAREIRRSVGRQWPGAVRLSLRTLQRKDLVEREYRPGPDFWCATPEGTRLGVVPYVTRLLGAIKPRHTGVAAAGFSVDRFRSVGTSHGPPIFSPEYGLANVSDPQALAEAFRTGTADDRAYAVTKLVALRDPASVPVLCEVAQRHGDEELLARKAVIALGSFQSPTSVEALIDIAAHRDSFMREAAARSLGHLKAADAIPTLVQLIGYPSKPVRAAAVRAVGRIGEPSVAGAVAVALGDDDAAVRRCTREALIELGAVHQLEENTGRPRPLRMLDVRRAREVAERRDHH